MRVQRELAAGARGLAEERLHEGFEACIPAHDGGVQIAYGVVGQLHLGRAVQAHLGPRLEEVVVARVSRIARISRSMGAWAALSLQALGRIGAFSRLTFKTILGRARWARSLAHPLLTRSLAHHHLTRALATQRCA